MSSATPIRQGWVLYYFGTPFWRATAPKVPGQATSLLSPSCTAPCWALLHKPFEGRLRSGKPYRFRNVKVIVCCGASHLWLHPWHVMYWLNLDSWFLDLKGSSSYVGMHMRSANMISTEHKCVIKTTAGIFLVMLHLEGLLNALNAFFSCWM